MTDAQSLLIQQEGLKLKVYTDSLGIETIGVGRNLREKGISKEEAIFLLNGDIADAIDDVRHCFSCYDNLSRVRQLVLISLAFNLGRERLNGFAKFIHWVHLGDYGQAADELMDSKAAKQAPLRYTQLADMMRENINLFEDTADERV